MKKIIFVILLFLFNFQIMGNSQESKKIIIQKTHNLSFYELKAEIINNLKLEIAPPISFNQDDAFLIVGIAAMAAFVISVLVFNKEIFGTLPLTLFAVGVAGIILGT